MINYEWTILVASLLHGNLCRSWSRDPLPAATAFAPSVGNHKPRQHGWDTPLPPQRNKKRSDVFLGSLVAMVASYMETSQLIN